MTIYTQEISTPLGLFVVGCSDHGICMIKFEDDEKNLQKFQDKFKLNLIQKNHPHLNNLKTQLSEYFQNTRTNFDLPLILLGTDFQKIVWNELLNILYGKTKSYQEQAISMNHPKAIRAMASANGENPIPIIIPCHRVIGKNGNLTGYRGGLWRKKFLLELEINLPK